MVPLKKKKELVRSFLEKERSPVEISQDHIQVDLEIIKKSFKGNKVVSAILWKATTLSTGSEYPWRWWACCYCNRNLSDFVSHGSHVSREHMEMEVPECQSDYLPDFLKEFPEEWTKQISESCWKPINVSNDGCWIPTTNGDVSLTDKERATFLEAIGGSFKTLIEKKILHCSQFSTILDYAKGAVGALPLEKLRKIKEVDWFRCLDARQLEHVLGILHKIEMWTEEENPSVDDDVFLAPQDDAFLAPPDSNIRVVLDHSRSSLHIYADGWFRQSGSSNGNASWKVNAEALVSWLYSGASVEDAVTSLIKAESVRYNLGPRTFEMYIKIFKKMSVLLGLKKDLKMYKDAFDEIEAKCEDEHWGRDEAEHAIRSFKAILEGWKESHAELSEEKSKVCMRAINQVLKRAEDIIKASANRDDEHKFDTQNGCDISEEDDAIMKALAEEKTELSMKFLQNTAQVKNTYAACHRLEKRMEQVSCVVILL